MSQCNGTHRIPGCRRLRYGIVIPLAFLSAGIVAADDTSLANAILGDTRLDTVLTLARSTVSSGFSAGSGYGEVWIRDFTTFMELACEVHPKELVRDKLLTFFHFQTENGDIADGYIPREQANISYKYRESASMPDVLAHKNTVETDQESSLVIGVCRYARCTGDTGIFAEDINDMTVSQRLERALGYVHGHRFDVTHGLVWGATTADWGDVQPEHEWGVELDESSHLAIDIYDNALYLVAIDEYLNSGAAIDEDTRIKWHGIRQTIADAVRAHLWDKDRGKFVPHIYLESSPFPASYDESAVHFHGGTAVAIEAGLLSRHEVTHVLRQMRANVQAAGAASIGLTVYPPYPRGFFKNPGMGPYSYQNGGDWTWFGARMIRQLVRHGLVEEAYTELLPMLDRVIANKGFHEWYTVDNKPKGSDTYRGCAGVLYSAIVDLRAWAASHANLDIKE
ncbi:MAG: hypothetical protein AMXMBFR84_36710 [Candidatus Hydrogenedentota bacterium]